MTLGSNIKKCRKMLRLSQEDLAKKSNLSRNAIYNYENDKRTPTMDILNKIATALDISVYALIENRLALNDYLANTKYNSDEDGVVDPRIFSQGLTRTGKTLEKVSEETGIDIKLLTYLDYGLFGILPKDKIKLLALALNVEFSTLLVDENKTFINIDTLELETELKFKGDVIDLFSGSGTIYENILNSLNDKTIKDDDQTIKFKSALADYLKYKNTSNDLDTVNELLKIINSIINYSNK